MPLIAFLVGTCTVIVPVAIVLGVDGYFFDLRRRSRRADADREPVGRRLSDHLAA